MSVLHYKIFHIFMDIFFADFNILIHSKVFFNGSENIKYHLMDRALACMDFI